MTSKAPAPVASVPARRRPVQERSRRRHDAILDAAALVFADAGFEAATMQAIAERAATSIGSVYQFFPDKLSVFEAVAERCLERSREAFDRVFASIPDDLPIESVIDASVDAFAGLNENDPAFRATVVNFALYPIYEARESALMRQMTRRIAELLVRRAPHLAPRRAKLVATMMVQLVSSMMFVSERATPRLRRAMRDETKTLVRRYVMPELEATKRAARRRR